MLDNKDLLKNLRLLEEEHRDLDEIIYQIFIIFLKQLIGH